MFDKVDSENVEQHDSIQNHDEKMYDDVETDLPVFAAKAPDTSTNHLPEFSLDVTGDTLKTGNPISDARPIANLETEEFVSCADGPITTLDGHPVPEPLHPTDQGNLTQLIGAGQFQNAQGNLTPAARAALREVIVGGCGVLQTYAGRASSTQDYINARLGPNSPQVRIEYDYDSANNAHGGPQPRIIVRVGNQVVGSVLARP